MKNGPLRSILDAGRLVHLSARLVAWRWFWLAALLPLLWPAYWVMALGFGWKPEAFQPYEIQNFIIALPLSILAIGLGVRIIAGDIDRRTLEIAYTVPGGSHRVWLAKIAAAFMILVVAELLLAVAAGIFLSDFPFSSLYVPMQAAVFYLVLAMALSVLFKSEVTAALVSIPFLTLGLMLAAGGVRVSPFFNTLTPQIADTSDAHAILSWTLQNRIGYAILIVALTAIAFARAERREKMMS